MKKLPKLLLVGLTGLMVVACDDIVARPEAVVNNENLISFGDNKNDYYDNDFEVIYDQLVDAGTANSTILEAIVTKIAKKEVSKFYNLTEEQFETVLNNVTLKLAGKTVEDYPNDIKDNADAIEAIITDEVSDRMIEMAKGDAYNVDMEFQEEKLVNELRSSLYTITVNEDLPQGERYTTNLVITPTLTYSDIFKADYSDYIVKEIYPDYLKTLLTSVYIYNREFTTIGRAYAREASYIQLQTIDGHPDSALQLINKYFSAYKDNKSTPTGTFDLDSIARIYNGVFDEEELSDPDSVASKEKAFAEENGIFTQNDKLMEDLSHVATTDGEDGYVFLKTTDPNFNETLASEFTGSYTYTIEKGLELKQKELQTADIVTNDDEMVIKSTGLGSLPDTISTRLFKTQIHRYVQDFEGIQMLAPESKPSDTPADDYVSTYAIYDSGTSSYYIVLVDGYYDTTYFQQYEENEEVAAKAKEVARILGETDNNQTQAVTYYLDYYDLEFGDQDFYDYIESNYPDVFDDKYSMND